MKINYKLVGQISLLTVLFSITVLFTMKSVMQINSSDDWNEILWISKHSSTANRDLMMKRCKRAIENDTFLRIDDNTRTYHKAKSTCRYYLFTLENRG
jgi:hypothetical protein